MDRRIWIKEIMFAAGGFVLIPACLNNASHSSIQLKNISIDDKQTGLLVNLVETIIPTKDDQNTKDLNIHLFVLKMVDDCYAKQDQDRFINGLKSFDGYSKQTMGNAFSDETMEKKIAFCKDVAIKKNVDQNIQYFLNTAKSLTILGYTQSKYFMTKLVPYELIPGHFNGCVKAST